jgi:hypothetical protein
LQRYFIFFSISSSDVKTLNNELTQYNVTKKKEQFCFVYI